MNNFFQSLNELKKQFNFKFSPKTNTENRATTKAKDFSKMNLGTFLNFKPFIRAKSDQNRIVCWIDYAVEANQILVRLTRKEAIVLIGQLIKSVFKSLWHWRNTSSIPNERN